MRYVCLTCDFDGTIARDGRVAASTLEALTKVRSSGRKLILATGRELDEVLGVFPQAGLFDRVVAENGGGPRAKSGSFWRNHRRNDLLMSYIAVGSSLSRSASPW